MGVSPFWERYPSQYLEKGGAPVFSKDIWVTEQHEKWLSEDYFPLVAQIRRNPRYTNKRIMDPQLKCFVDECGVEIPPEWGLPTPNADASYKSLAKYGKDLLPMSEDMVVAMNLAWTFTERHFGLYMKNADVISYEDAKAKLDMKTSTGSPFNQHHKTKQELFDKDPEIDAWLQEDWTRMGVDDKWTCLFTNSLKEELRLAEKIDENSIRTFLSGGVDAVVHGTRLFVDMNEKMYDSHLKTSSAVGMSPYKGNWDRLYKKLKAFRLGYALDESQYDSSLRSFLMWGCARMRWNMLKDEFKTPENLRRILNYYRNLVSTLVICPDGVIVMKKTGNPSGSVNTITDNTLILYTLLAYAWIRTSRPEYRSYESFEMHTAKALVGDDNTWTVSDEAHEFYNATTVIEEWKTIGVTTTTDAMYPRKPEELDFLSAHTVFLNGKAVPIYSRVKLMNSLLYAPREHITPATTLERTAAMLSVGWTDLPFRHFCRDAIDWLLEKYDDILNDEPRWILAKCQIQTDDHYFRLFTGERAFLMHPQGISGGTVKLTQPDKSVMNRANPKRNGTQPGKKTRKTRAGRRGRAGAQQVVVVRATPAKQVARIKRRPQRPRRQGRNGGMLTMKGNSRTGMRTKRVCTVEEDEFIGAVLGSVNFANTAYPINPGQATTFPWLAKQAAQWEKYHINYLEFYYKRDVSEFATNGTTGKVILSVDFDASDAPPITKQQIEDTDPRVDGMPCENLRMPLRSNDLHSLYPTLYVRPGGLPGATDIKTYDAGNFNIATQGCQNTSEIGELRVKYSVTFSVPVLEAFTSAPANNSVAMFETQVGAAGNLTTAVAFVLPLAAVTTNGLSAVNTAGSIVLPAGNYLIDAWASIAFTGASTVTLVEVFKNVTSINLNPSEYQMTSATAAFTECTVSGYVSLNGTDTLKLSITGTFSSGNASPGGYMRITAI